MKIVVIGLGSMGKRRIRLLKKYDKTIEIAGVDAQIGRVKECVELYGILGYTDLNTALTELKPDCAFVASSPQSHSTIINQCLNEGCHVFTELNLILNGCEENIRLAKEMKKVLFLSSTFLYREEIRYIIQKIKKFGKTLNYCYHVGQYLPDWHPWESYKDFFVSRPETNACREIFAIEMPWLLSAFGKVSGITVSKGNISSLDITFPDYYMVQIVHENGCKGQLMIDIVSKKAVRNLEIIGENFYTRWNGTPKGLYSLEEGIEKQIWLYDTVEKMDNYSDNIVENAYYNEICTFFRVIEGTGEAYYTANEDIDTLKLIDRIEGN